jgi:tetratricopeptide (TPR) repeat protein
MLLAEALSSSKLGQLVRQGLQIQGARLTGNYPLAIETYRQLLGDLETAFGKGDPKLLLAQGDFAGLLWEAGYYGEAFELIEPVLETGRRIAPRHPRLHDALGHLASELVQAGRYSEAERHLRDALAMKTEPLERDLELWQGLAIVLLETDRVPEAQEVLDRARQLRIEDPALSAWFTYLDSLACRARDPTRSRDLMDQAYRAIEGLSPVSLGTVGLTRAATIFAELEQWEKALEFRQQALRLEERKRPAQHPKIADQLHALGHLRMKLNQWDQARQDLVLALEIRRNRLPEADRRIQDSQSLLQQIP